MLCLIRHGCSFDHVNGSCFEFSAIEHRKAGGLRVGPPTLSAPVVFPLHVLKYLRLNVMNSSERSCLTGIAVHIPQLCPHAAALWSRKHNLRKQRHRSLLINSFGVFKSDHKRLPKGTDAFHCPVRTKKIVLRAHIRLWKCIMLLSLYQL